MHWYVMAFERFADFNGRSRRKEYWMFFLFNMLIGMGLSVGDLMLGLFSDTLSMGAFGALYSLVVLVPSWALAVRRLHDTGRSGWWLVAPLGVAVPMGVGVALTAAAGAGEGALLLVVPGSLAMAGLAIAVFVFSVLDGQPFPNRYGPDPKGRGGDVAM